MVSLEMFKDQFHSLKEVEGRKDLLIENLILRVEELEGDLTEKRRHLEREQETTKLYQSKHRDVEVKLKRMDEEIDSNSFVSVLIDGDGMMFVDSLVKPAQKGGLEAVLRLKNAVREYVSNNLELRSQIPIRIRIYANIKGLASAYYYNKVLDSAEGLSVFVRGFNMGDSMCDFVDAGDGKECADTKLKACFNRDMADVQCRTVIFGGSTDAGYARLLVPYVGDKSRSNRIVLIQGPPFAKELAELQEEFRIAHFPDIFRNAKLPSCYTTAVASPTSAATDRTENIYEPPVTVTVIEDYPVLQNSKGQRLDALINPPLTLVNHLRYTKHCNMFHILGECNFSHCNYLHGGRLDKKGIEARRSILRQTPCKLGLQCKDEKCLDGHQCPDKACARIGKGCRFAMEMHNVDRS